MIRDLKNGMFDTTEGIIDFPLFNKEIHICIQKNVKMEYAEKCVAYLHELPQTTIEQFCEGAIEYCEDFREKFEDEGLDIQECTEPRQILQYIQPSNMEIELPEDEAIVAFRLNFACDWESEHAMECILLGDDILYVGAVRCISPWDDVFEIKNLAGNYA